MKGHYNARMSRRLSTEDLCRAAERARADARSSRRSINRVARNIETLNQKIEGREPFMPRKKDGKPFVGFILNPA